MKIKDKYTTAVDISFLHFYKLPEQTPCSWFILQEIISLMPQQIF